MRRTRMPPATPWQAIPKRSRCPCCAAFSAVTLMRCVGHLEHGARLLLGSRFCMCLWRAAAIRRSLSKPTRSSNRSPSYCACCRMGLLAEAIKLIGTAMAMERHRPKGEKAITEFDRLFEVGYRAS